MPRRFRVGLTGGIASGKTTAAERFAELGIPVVDADVAARAVVAAGQPGLERLAQTFGTAILTADGALDRRALRNMIFADPAVRKTVESLLHPLIQAETERLTEIAVGPYLILSIPLLVEGGKLNRIDRILVVDVDEGVQLQRVMARDATTLDQARAILAAQATRKARLDAADDVVVNSGSIADLRDAVDALHSRYLSLAPAATPRPTV